MSEHTPLEQFLYDTGIAMPGDVRRIARKIEGSEWLAAHDAEVRARGEYYEGFEEGIKVGRAEARAGVVAEEPEWDRAPCRAELWSWDYFNSEAVDPYWMHCHLIGKHDRHENSETGATWAGE